MAAHDVFKAIAPQVDSDFLAIDILPILWQFSLGPLLNLPQFQAYMTLIKSTSARVEQEQTRKLQELGANSTTATSRNEFMSFGGPPASNGFDSTSGADDTNFEALVRGSNQGTTGGSDMLGGDPWANASANASASSSTVLPSRPANRADNASPAPATFSWSTPSVSPPPPTNLSAPQGNSRAITPDNTFASLNSSFPAMNPTNPGIGSPIFAQQQQNRPAMGMNSMIAPPTTTPSYTAPSSGIDWSKATTSSTSTWGSSTTNNTMSSGLSNFSAIAPSQPQHQPPRQATASPYSAFSIAPPPIKPASSGTFSIAPPPMLNAGSRSTSASGGMGAMKGGGMNSMAALRAQTQSQQTQRPQNQTSSTTNWGNGDSLI